MLRFLADESCDFAAVNALRADGFDVLSVAQNSSGATDERVIELALLECRILLTEDKDFGELIVVQRRPHSGIIRFLELPIAEQAMAMQEVLTYYQADLKSGP